MKIFTKNRTSLMAHKIVNFVFQSKRMIRALIFIGLLGLSQMASAGKLKAFFLIVHFILRSRDHIWKHTCLLLVVRLTTNKMKMVNFKGTLKSPLFLKMERRLLTSKVQSA